LGAIYRKLLTIMKPGTFGAVVTQVIVLNGGSSSGKSGIARCVRCDARIAAGRELARGDRIIGMAASQAELVHRGIVNDLQVDTTHTEALECAQAIAAHAQ
jgi:chloramphenicol 3-O-phosphotransferase